MVDSLNLNFVENSNQLFYDKLKESNLAASSEPNDVSIFAGSVDLNAAALEDELAAVQDEQGVFMNAWDDFKGFLGVGTSSSKCEDAIERYKNGDISYEEALSEIEKFDTKQSSSLDLFANIATGVSAVVAGTAAAAAVVATGGAAAPAVIAALAGAGAGAVTKSGVKFTDRATNNIKDDALDGKQIAKDAISGAISGAISAATIGNGSVIGAKAGAIKSAKLGVKTGAISGSSNYLLDCAFDENKDFNVGELALNTASGALVSGAVGGIMGAANCTLKSNKLLTSGGKLETVKDAAGNQVLAHSSARDIAANSLCSTEYKLLNKGIRDAANSIAA